MLIEDVLLCEELEPLEPLLVEIELLLVEIELEEVDEVEIDDDDEDVEEVELAELEDKSSIDRILSRSFPGPGNCKSPVWNVKTSVSLTSPETRVSVNVAW